MNNDKVKPLFKYIGGKSWLREELRNKVELILNKTKVTGYVEPFAGGLGSFLAVSDILLAKKINNVFLSDINEVLVHTYQSVKDNPDELLKQFLMIEKGFSETVDSNWKKTKDKNEIKSYLKDSVIYFNQIKKEFNKNKASVSSEQSARLIFLQKHAFNGVYRENSKGEYNTPFNWSGSNMLDTIEEKIKEFNGLLNQFNLTFKTQSYSDLTYTSDNLYYLDPPYLNDEIEENKYHKDVFGKSAQTNLINNIKGMNFLYSNHKSDFLIKLLQENKNLVIDEIVRKNIMSASAQTRQEDKIEILAYNII